MKNIRNYVSSKSCRLFILFLLSFHSTSNSSTFEPILVESCVDSKAGDCHAGKANCNLRAAVELCIELAPPLCTVLLPYGVHHINYGALNITTNSSSRISITSSNSISDPCYNFRSGDEERAIVDGSSQRDRLLNVNMGGYIELSNIDVKNFGNENLNRGGAILSEGVFLAIDVNFYGNQAKLGSVAFNGEFGGLVDDQLETLHETEGLGGGDKGIMKSIEDYRKGGRIISDTSSTLYVQHCSCDTVTTSDHPSIFRAKDKSGSTDTESVDIYSASGQSYLDCSLSCTIDGSVKSSTTCVPTSVPSGIPSATPVPSLERHDDSAANDDSGDNNDGGGDDDDDDIFSVLAGGVSAVTIAVILSAIMCILLGCMLGIGKDSSRCRKRRINSLTGQQISKDLMEEEQRQTRVNSAILDSMYKHFGVDSETRSSQDQRLDLDPCIENSPLCEPFLQAALDSMEGKPGDWIIDVRALELGPMIGVGSSAHVFSATYFGQRVAAKRLPALTWKPEEVETFLRHEAGLLVHLHHPSVIKFYGVGIAGDYVFMVTELCCGSLTNLIDRANSHPGVQQAAQSAVQRFLKLKETSSSDIESGLNGNITETSVALEAAAITAAMPLSLLLSLALGIAQGVEFLHSRGVVHRDLKPDNVLLTESNEVKLCDFGISRMEKDRSGMTTAVGTPLLMAPELVLSETASQVETSATAVDVFSFGILLWMISTQHLCPYDGVENPWLLLSQVTQGRRPKLTIDSSSEGMKLRGTNLMKLPQQFRDLIAQCWHQDPATRPTFSTITQDLDILLEQMEGSDQFI